MGMWLLVLRLARLGQGPPASGNPVMGLVKNWELVPSERESEQSNPWASSLTACALPSLQTSQSNFKLGSSNA